MAKRCNTPRQKDRLNKVKKDNQRLRALGNRQRHNIKSLLAVIIQARAALVRNEILGAMAHLSTNVKYPPSASMFINCRHEYAEEYVRRCKYCKEEKGYGDV